MIIKPARLQKGDIIGIIAPSGAIKEEALNKGVKTLKNLGYNIKLSDNILEQKKYLAGNDTSRKNDLEAMFKDKEVKAIICARGGYGSSRLLENIDYGVIRENPKIFCGYSDITALQLAFLKECSLVTFFAPMLVSDFGKKELEEKTINHFEKIFNTEIEIPLIYKAKDNYECIYQGEAKGKIFIANLSILTSIIGTRFMPDITDYILVIEDIAEPLYKIDRMLNYLKLTGTLDKLKGLMVGEFTKTEATREEIIGLIKETIPSIPCGIGFNLSHENYKCTCPNGIEASFDAKTGELILLEEFLNKKRPL